MQQITALVFFALGVDFAWSTNGYVYHTKFDTANQIPMGSLQRTGDNILALARGITVGHYLGETTVADSDGSLVFFDFLGAFVIRWPQYIAGIVNVASLVLGAYSIYLNMESARRGESKNRKTIFFFVPLRLHRSNQLFVSFADLRTSTYVKHILICTGAVIGSWLISMIFATFIALVLTKLGKVMSWYARPTWLFFLYICPTVSMSMLLFLYMGSRQRQVGKDDKKNHYLDSQPIT